MHIYIVVWCIVARAPAYKSGSGRCTLCLTEKSVIIGTNPRGLLNKRTELISKFHRNVELHVSSLMSGNTKLYVATRWF